MSKHSIDNVQDELDFRSMLYEFFEHKFFILVVTGIIFSLGVLYALKKTPQYQANALIHVENHEQANLGFLSSIAQFSPGMSAPTDPASVQTALIKSRFILEPVIKELQLDLSVKPYHFPLLGWLFSNDSQEKIKVAEYRIPSKYNNKKLNLVFDKPDHFSLSFKGILLLAGDVGPEVKSADGQFLLRINKIMDLPVGSKYILTKYSDINIVNSLILGLKVVDLGYSSTDRQKTGVLQISLLDPNPERLIKILNKIVDVVIAEDAKRKSFDAEKMLLFLNQQMPLVKASLDEAETKLNLYRAKSGKVDVRFQMQSILKQLADLDKQISTLRMNKIALLQQVTNEHPYVVEINFKLKALNEIKTELENELKELPASDQVVIEMMRDVKVKNALYLEILNKIQDMQITKAGALSDVKALSLAVKPDEAIASGKGFVIFFSLIFGLITGCVLVLVRKALLQRISEPHWIEKKFDIVNIAILPFSNEQKVNENDKHKTLLAIKNPADLTIESLRSLRTSLQVLLFGASNNIVAITGISPGIGKSFISSNFAYLMADVGKRVLLIDGDIRRGVLQKQFQVSRTPGLTDILNGTATVEQSLHKTMHGNLTFLSTGECLAKSSELLMSDRLKDLLASFSAQFDLIIIDTAPILAVTDAAIFCSLSGTNLLVAGCNLHQAKEIELAIKKFNNVNVKLHGYIFNYLKPESKIYGKSQFNYHYEYKSNQTVDA